MKINKLTKEQESLLPVYLDKWLKVGRRTETIDREKAKSSINFLYTEILKINKPKHYLFVDSPMACNITLGLLEGLTGKKESQLGSQLGSQLYSKLDSKLDSQLDSQLGRQLYSKLGRQLDSQLGRQLYSKLGRQLDSQLYSQLGKIIYESRSNWSNSYYFYYDFILAELFPEKKKDFKLFTDFLEGSKEYHHVYLSPEVAIFSDFPEQIHVNNEGKLNFDKGMALKYRDGYGIYALDGNRIDAKSPVELAIAGVINE
jgi:hypothetical protein